MSLVNSATVLVALTLLLVTAFAADPPLAGPSNPKAGKSTTNAPRTLPPGLNDDGTGRGEQHCQWCGYITDTGLPAVNVSRCSLGQDENSVSTTTAAPGVSPFTFTCECRSEFTGNGYECNDRDECTLNEDNCDNNAKCENKIPGFECSCKPGFRDESVTSNKGSICNNIDECKETPGICGNGTGTCTDTEGSYTCACEKGYEYNSDNTTCVDKNECMANNGDCEQQCVNSVGSFSCACYSGYELDGDKCKTINECERIRNPCGYNAHCVDTDAGYYCACNKGFEWDPKDLFNRHCIDIDECKEKTLDCSGFAHTECYNSYGSADCVCEAGWTGEKDNCMDVDECMLGTDHCHHNGTCINKDGTYDCTCNAGYTGTGFMCGDLDECKDPKTNDCSENARCINTVGDFDCSCIYGYAGDGRNCTLVGEDLDEKSFKIAKSRLMIQVHLLDHDRQELEVEHERLLRECAKQAAQRPAFRRRREVIDVTNETYESAKAWVITLRKINADLALANHALRVSCKE